MNSKLPNNRFDLIGQLMSDPAALMGLVSIAMITSILEDIAKNLTQKLAHAFRTTGEIIDDDYRDRFALALYWSAISFTHDAFTENGGIFNWAWNMMTQRPDDCNMDAIYNHFQKGFGEISPSMAAACTPEVILKTAHLLLNDWLNNGEPDEDTLNFDTHFYFDEVLKLEGNLDSDAMHREGADHILAMSEAELSEYPPEMIEVVRQWAAENPKAE